MRAEQASVVPFGDFETVSKFLDDDNAPQSPVILREPLEILASLKLLQQGQDSLTITFDGQPQHYQSLLVELDRERGLLALDELMPADGEARLLAGERFQVQGYHEGIRMAWHVERAGIRRGNHQGHPCYWMELPEEVDYHQRRDAYRAPLKSTQTPTINLAGSLLSPSLVGKLLDISATGCKLRFPGNVMSVLERGEVYERLSIALPEATLVLAAELRHLHYEERQEASFAGMRFHDISGLEQRQIERFVFQVQRESRRFER
jgi:c-di-GMP-binding flagellar brake protein YcgR